ncbi:6-bladed beta-propeller [Algoriphagus namhaensis]
MTSVAGTVFNAAELSQFYASFSSKCQGQMKIFTKYPLIIALVSLGLLNQYCSNKQKIKVNYLKPIPIPVTYTEKLSEFVEEIEYVLLPENMRAVQIDKMQQFGDLIFLGDYELTKTVSIVNIKTGEVTNINRVGGGPDEYQYILDFTINREREQVEILDLNRLISYDFRGNFVEETRLPASFEKISNFSANQYVVYIARSLHSNFDRPDSESILWKWDKKSGNIERLACASEQVKLPYFTERNNLSFQNDEILFSANFLDSVYVYGKDMVIREVRYFDGIKDHMPFDLITRYNGDFPEELRNEYFFHLPNLLESENYFFTTLMTDSQWVNLLYSKADNTTVIFSKIENDIDGGYPYMPILHLDDNYLYSLVEPQYLMEHYEQYGEKPIGKFSDFTSSLTINSPLVLIRYKLKDA